MPNSLTIWLAASRPKTLAAGIGPVLLGSALAWRDGLVEPWVVVACLIGAMGLQIGANLSNDYYDGVKGTDNADRLGPTRAVAAGLLTPRAVQIGSYLAFAVAGAAAVAMYGRGGWVVLLIWVTGVLCAIAYTGGPFPLGYNGLGDIAAFLFFGPVAVAGTYYVHSGGRLDGLALTLGAAAGLYSIALITVNNMRDIDSDRAAGKRTLAVLLGRQFARWEYSLALMLSALIPGLLVQQGYLPPPLLAGCVIPLAAIRPLVAIWTRTDGPALNRALAQTGALTLVYCLGLTMALVIAGPVAVIEPAP